MNRILLRDIQKEVARSLSRFLAIALIVALGVGFLYGIKATSPAMKYTADRYFDQQHFMDLHIVSPLGFSAADAEELGKQPGIERVVATNTLSAMIEGDDGLKSVLLPCPTLGKHGDESTRAGKGPLA